MVSRGYRAEEVRREAGEAEGPLAPRDIPVRSRWEEGGGRERPRKVSWRRVEAAGCTGDEEERGGRQERQRGGGGTHRDGRDMVALGKDSDGVVRPWPGPGPTRAGVGHGGNHLDPKQQW